MLRVNVRYGVRYLGIWNMFSSAIPNYGTPQNLWRHIFRAHKYHIEAVDNGTFFDPHLRCENFYHSELVRCAMLVVVVFSCV